MWRQVFKASFPELVGDRHSVSVVPLPGIFWRHPFEEINSDDEYPTYVIVQKADFDNIISLNLLHSSVGSG
jgi:hypothetical protein